MPDTDNRTRLTPNQTIALVVGAAYLLAGIAGFAVTGFDDFFAKDSQETLLGFEVNGLHNVVHLALGLFGVALWRRHDTARVYGWILVAVYGPTFLYGLWAAGNTEGNILSINGADNGLHLVTAAIGLFIALKPAPIDLRDRDDVHETGGQRRSRQATGA